MEANGRRLGATMAALLLAGCHSVTSATPWFAKGDAAGAPPLRQGVWVLLAENGKPCPVHEDQPITAWPECALPVVVREDDVIGLDKKDGVLTWSSMPYVFAAGDPRILQFANDDSASSYNYGAAEAIRLDAQGRVIAFRGWIVACGPPSTSPAGEIPPLFSGLSSAGSGCTAASLDALRAAAKASEPLKDNSAQARWVREGYR